jgi:hypothetical protein
LLLNEKVSCKTPLTAFKFLRTVRLFVPKAVAISATVGPFARNCMVLVGSAFVVPFRRPL